jgi:hypothetical protein
MNYIGDKTSQSLLDQVSVQSVQCSNYGLMSDMVSTCLQTYHKTYFKYYLDEIGKE